MNLNFMYIFRTAQFYLFTFKLMFAGLQSQLPMFPRINNDMQLFVSNNDQTLLGKTLYRVVFTSFRRKEIQNTSCANYTFY